MHAFFRFEKPVGPITLHQERHALQTGLFALQQIQYLQPVAMPLRPATIHPVQHRHPVLGLSATGTGMQGQNSVVVVILTFQQHLQLQVMAGRGEILNFPGNLHNNGVIVLFHR